MPSQSPARGPVTGGPARSRRTKRRRQLPLLALAGLLGAVLIVWAVLGGSLRGSGSGRTTARARVAARHAAPTSAAVAVAPGPATVRPLEPGPRTRPRWVNPERWSGAPPALLVTHVTTDTQSDVATIAWFRASRTQLALYPGTGNPGTTAADRGPAAVPLGARAGLVATFNSGFYEKDAAAGFYAHGHLYHSMIDGLATVVAYADGKVDIIRWAGGSAPGPGIVMARQNLALLVTGGRPSPLAGILSDWGITWHGSPAVWRSGIGVDANGNLIYAAGPALTVSGLANVMLAAGAVRAMQLDINPEWPILVSFGRPGGLASTLVTPNPNQIPSRFLYPSVKDFFAVYLRSGAAQPQPW